MTPELRAALFNVLPDEPLGWGSEHIIIAAIEPIIDAALAEAVDDVIYLDWAPKLRRDALLAAANDLDEKRKECRAYDEFGFVADWLRDRANEGTGA